MKRRGRNERDFKVRLHLLVNTSTCDESLQHFSTLRGESLKGHGMVMFRF